MAQLSRRGWNNVLIFSVLAFIIIFQLSNQRLMDNPPSTSAPLAADAVVLEVHFPEGAFQRVGTRWRSTSEAWQGEQIESWLSTFYQAYPTRLLADPAISEFTIQLMILAQAEPKVFTWLPEQQLLYQPATQLAWQLPAERIASLTQAFQP